MATNVCLNPVNFCAEGLEEAPARVSVNTIFDFRTEDYRDVFAFQPFPRPLSEYTDSLGRTARVFAADAGFSVASLVDSQRGRSLPRTSVTASHDFQITEAGMGGEILVLFALASLFGRRVPERIPTEVPEGLRGIYQGFEAMYARQSEIPRVLENLRRRLNTPPDRHVGVTDAYRTERRRLALQIQVLETLQKTFENPGTPLPSAAELVRHLTETAWNEAVLGPRPASLASQTVLDIEIDSISRLRAEYSQRLLAVDQQLTQHRANLARHEQEVSMLERDRRILNGRESGTLHYHYPSTSGFNSELYHNGQRLSEALRSAEEFTRTIGGLETRRAGVQANLGETTLVHDSLQLIRNLHRLEHNAFDAAFSE